MINLVHKKIVLVFVLIANVTVPMEQQPLYVSNYTGEQCWSAFADETMCAGMISLTHLFITSGITDPDPGELSFRKNLFARGAIWSGLSAGALLMTRCMSDNCMDCPDQLVAAKYAISLCITSSMIQQARLVGRKAINQWRQDPKGTNSRSLQSEDMKQIWKFFKQQIAWPDYLVSLVGVGLLSMILSI